MNTITKIVLSALIAAVIAGGVYGGYKYLLVPQIQQVAGASPQGATGRSAYQYNIYGVNMAAPGANATSSSVLNNSGQNLFVTGLKANCTGVGTSKTAYTGAGLAALTFAIGTSTTANPPTASSLGNEPGNSTLTVATSSTLFGMSSSTEASPGNGNPGIVWANNTYMTWQSNATNTAICTLSTDVTSS